MIKSLSTLLIGVLLVFSSCEKETVGPQGIVVTEGN